MKSFRYVSLLLCSLFYFYSAGAQDTTQKIVAGRVNAPEQEQKPYLIVISADGFRYDLADKYHADNLRQLRDSGVAAEYMTPSFPSLTFPNHYSIATGLYPSHHGIVDNSFYDRNKMSSYSLGNSKAVVDSSWYGGTPIWVLAEKEHMLTASFYWVGSEAAIQGIRPTYYYTYNYLIGMESRIRTVRDWLTLPADKRPHLILFYLNEPDHQEHRFGPESGQAADAVHEVDRAVGRMVQMTDSLHLPVNFIFVSDHGMTSVDTVHTLSLPEALDTSHFIISGGLTLVHLYAKDKKYIEPAYKALKDHAEGYEVYLTAKTPKAWHYDSRDDQFNREGDILLVAKPPKVFNLSHRHVPAGEHGYDPSVDEMHASFYAWGPAFRQHLKMAHFENVNLFPLMSAILGLKYDSPVDGKLSEVSGALR